MIATPSYLTADEYLAFEQTSQTKHEYRNGQIYAMAGASNNHVTIAGNLFASLRFTLRDTGCRPYISDTKIHIPAKNTYYYPDVVVSCDSRESGLNHFLAYPCLVVEVLSDTTEAFDRGDKFADYRQLDSLTEYVLISQKQVAVDVFHRNEQDQWVLSAYNASHSFRLQSINVDIEVAELYEDVEFAEESSTPPDAGQ
ncbi:MAG: Uma2 family endonuclease [Merismopedia sp. SIO2A8]|nr:Uma2 family endonuclease [Merismopedia sp. SIO2A8]